MAIVTKEKFLKIEQFLRKILDALHMKLFVYKIIMIPTQEIALYRLRKIMKNSCNLEKKDKNGKKILFISIDARHTPHTYIEGGIAKFLQIRGHEVKMVICNRVLSMCTTHFTIKKPFSPWVCKNCANFSKKFYEITKLPYASYNEYITQNNIESIKKSVNKISIEECEKYVYKGVTVGYHAVISAQRYFLGDTQSGPIYESILRTELINAMISTDVAKEALNKEKPDILISSHGCYSSWGSFSDYFMNNGIPIYVWGTGETHTIRFVYPKYDFKKYFNQVRQKRLLNEDEEKELNYFFNRRKKGEEGQVILYGFSEKTEEELKKNYAFQNFEKTYVMFPNVPWDSAAFATGEKIAFQDIYDWFLFNVELFKNKPKFQLIIKIHPAEVKVMESKSTIVDFTADKCYPLTENIKIIPPDTTISPYSLFPYIDVGLVYTGTIGLEMSMKGIPVITGGSAHYANKGFTYDINTKDEYAKKIFNDFSISLDQQKLAMLYAYFYFIKCYVPNSFMFSNNFINLGWKMHSLDEVKPGKNKYVDHICDYIIKGKVYQNW